MSWRAIPTLIIALLALSATTGNAVRAAENTAVSTELPSRNVVAVVPRDWPPQYGVDADGKPTGFAIEIMDKIAALAGLWVSYRVVDDFAAVEEMMARGEADIVPNSGITPERASRFLFTAPVETIAVSIFVRSNTHNISRIEDLVGRKVGVVKASVGIDIVKINPDIKAEVQSTPQGALFELLAGHIDAIIYPRPVLQRLAREVRVEGRVKTVGDPVAEIKRAIRVQKSKPELLAVLDKAVKEFIEAPAYRQIYVKWYGKSVPFWDVSRVAWIMGALLAIVLLAFALWRYRLTRELTRRLAASEEKFRDLIEGGVPGVLIHRNQKPLFVNKAYAGIFGYDSPEEMLRQPSALDHVAPHEQERLKEIMNRRLWGLPAPEVYAFQGIKKDGSPIWLENRGRLVDWEGAAAVQRTVVDITARKLAELKLVAHTRRQAMLAELGQRALQEDDLAAVMNAAVDLIVRLLKVDYCEVLELMPGGDRLLLRAGKGWKPGLVGTFMIGIEESGQAAFEMRAKEIVSFEDLSAETRFRPSPLLIQHGVVSGMTLTIGDVEQPYGLLGVHSKVKRTFTEDDVATLGMVVMVMANAASRWRAEEAMRKSETRLRGAVESLQEGFALYDADDHLVMVNDVFRRIIPGSDGYLKMGLRFEELMRTLVESGLILDAVGREEDFIRERVELHRNPKGPILRHHSDGTWNIVKESRTPEGGIAVTITDVTELKRIENALRESREQLRAVVDGSPSPVTLKDKSGRYLMVNRAFAAWMASEPKDLIGKSIYDMLPNDAAEIMRVDQEVYQTGRMLTAELMVGYPDGVTRDILVTKGPIHSTGGEIAAVCTVVIDVTELKRKDRALAAARERFRVIVDNLPMGVNLKDKDRRFLLLNKKYEEWLGVSEADVLGKRAEDVIDEPIAQVDARFEHESAVLDRNTAVTRPCRVLRPDGTFQEVEITKFRIRGGDDEVALLGTITVDITDRKRAEMAMAELRAELAHVSRVSTMGEMTAGLAHELNQPLTAITNFAKGSLRRLNAGGRSVDLLPILELIADQALRAGDIIRKIRGFMNRTEPQKTRIDLRKTIHEVIGLMSGEFHLSGVDVVVKVPDSMPPVMADSIQVQQVLINLIRNAVSAMDGDASNHHRLEIGALDPDGKAVEIYVKDNGPGVAPDLADRLFEPFFTTKTDGLGMGLSLSRTIVTGHNGRIWMTSESGDGATFHFTIPTDAGDRHEQA